MHRGDQIRLQLPAQPEYGRVARIAAAQLALRLGFSLHEIDDLRLAMDEAAILLLGPEVAGRTLTIDYETGDHTIGVDARIDDGDETPPVPDDRLTRFSELVGELIDEYSIDPTAHRITLSKVRNG